MAIRFLFSPQDIQFTGRELCSHFAFRMFDLPGDSVVAFCGMCWVEPENLIDLRERKRNQRIFSHGMLHFIFENFDQDLTRAIFRQRLFATIVQQELQVRGVQNVVRRGDDLFQGDSKLTVSVATLSPVSAMVHFGINVISNGTPVKTRGLQDLKIDPRGLALAVMEAYRLEMEAIEEARAKVRGVP